MKFPQIPGFGYNENGKITERLTHVKMPIVTYEECIRSKPEFYSRITSEHSFCAGFRNGSSVCNGDSGGGMVFQQNQRWFLKGIVSVSAALDENRNRCDPLNFVVFTDVAKFGNWITDVLF